LTIKSIDELFSQQTQGHRAQRGHSSFVQAIDPLVGAESKNLSKMVGFQLRRLDGVPMSDSQPHLDDRPALHSVTLFLIEHR
jgi:hypothetical protein